MSKPVELIATNLLHAYAEAVEQAPPVMRASVDMATLTSEMTRKLLCHIAHDASLATVVRALEAAGVPGGVEALAQRFAAVRETRAEEGCAAPAPEAGGGTPADPAAATIEFLRRVFGQGVHITPAKPSDSSK